MNRDTLRETYPRRADDVEYIPYTGKIIESLETTVDRVTATEPQDEMERRTR